MAVAAPIALSVANIAAGATGGPGDGSVALRLAGLRTTGVAAAGGQTLSELYGGVVTSVVVLTRAAEQGSASQDTLVANVAAQRSSVSDVSIDEEMVSLIQGQQAFAAASKIVGAADEMMQAGGSVIRRSSGPRLAPPLERQAELRAAAHLRNVLQAPSGSLGQVTRHRQPESRRAGRLPPAHERLEQPVEHLGRNPGAGVADRDVDPVAVGRGSDRDPAAALLPHRRQRIQKKVEQDLLEILLDASHRRQAGPRLGIRLAAQVQHYAGPVEPVKRGDETQAVGN